jgi:hypothetical protein
MTIIQKTIRARGLTPEALQDIPNAIGRGSCLDLNPFRSIRLLEPQAFIAETEGSASSQSG